MKYEEWLKKYFKKPKTLKIYEDKSKFSSKRYTEPELKKLYKQAYPSIKNGE